MDKVELSAQQVVNPYDGVTTRADSDANANHRKVDLLEAAIRSQLPTVDLTDHTTHHFAPGLYARELRIPAGTLLTGKIHRTRHMNIVSQGRITVWSADEGTRTIEAPYTFVSEPGTRRVGFAHEDTVWTTLHPTDETDLEVLEEKLIEPRAVDALYHVESAEALKQITAQLVEADLQGVS